MEIFDLIHLNKQLYGVGEPKLSFLKFNSDEFTLDLPNVNNNQFLFIGCRCFFVYAYYSGGKWNYSNNLLEVNDYIKIKEIVDRVNNVISHGLRFMFYSVYPFKFDAKSDNRFMYDYPVFFTPVLLEYDPEVQIW